MVAGALLDGDYAARIGDPAWFAGEQARVHAAANRLWPRALGTTPWGMARAIGWHGVGHRVGYDWRLLRPPDDLADVGRAVRAHWPVAMLIGDVLPRHWVLMVEGDDELVQCYEPSSGEVRSIPWRDVGRARLRGLGFPRAFAVVLPRRRIAIPRSNI